MIDPHDFSKMQFDLTAEFGKYVFDHPEVDDILPDGAYVYFEVEGEPEFSAYSRPWWSPGCLGRLPRDERRL